MGTYNHWNDLSIKEKSDMMKVAVRNGITKLADIKAKYNEFAEGGNIYSGTKAGSQQMKQMSSAGGYVYDIIPRLLAQDGVHVMVSSGYRPGSMTKSGNKSRHSTHEAADIIPIKGSSFADINRVINDPNSATSRWMLANGYGYIDETSATGTTKYWHDYKKDHSHYHIGRDSSYAKQYASRMGGTSRGEYTQPVAIQQQPYIPQETLAFEPSNPEAFFAPLGTYNTPVIEREVEQPLVEAANEYSEEALKRAEQRQGLNNFLTVLSLTNPNNSSDDFFSGITSMLTGSPLTSLANLSAEGGHLYPDGGDKSWYIPQSQVSVDPRTGNTYNPNTGTYNGVLVPAEVVVTPQSQTAMSGLEVAKELNDNQYRTMPTNSEANAYADWWAERTAPGIGDFVGATLKPLDLITPSRYVGLMDSDNNRGFLHLFDDNNRGLFINNNPQGFFSKRYAEEHPLLAMAGNAAFDIPAGIAAGWAAGKGLNATNNAYNGIGNYVDNVERRGIETLMRTTPVYNPVPEAWEQFKYLLRGNQGGKTRLAHIANYILSGNKIGPKGYYNSLAPFTSFNTSSLVKDVPFTQKLEDFLNPVGTSRAYSGFIQDRTTPIMFDRDDIIDAYLYGKDIDPSFGLKKIATGDDFGPHSSYINEKYADKATNIPVYETATIEKYPESSVTSSNIWHSADDGMFKTGNTDDYVNAAGHLYSRGYSKDFTPLIKQQDIWKFNPDEYYSKWLDKERMASGKEPLTPFKKAIYKFGIKELDRLGTPIITRTKWINQKDARFTPIRKH